MPCQMTAFSLSFSLLTLKLYLAIFNLVFRILVFQFKAGKKRSGQKRSYKLQPWTLSITPKRSAWSELCMNQSSCEAATNDVTQDTKNRFGCGRFENNIKGW